MSTESKSNKSRVCFIVKKVSTLHWKSPSKGDSRMHCIAFWLPKEIIMDNNMEQAKEISLKV